MAEVGWAEIGFAGWMRTSRTDDGTAVVVEGKCPRCEHDTIFRMDHGLPGGLGAKGVPGEDAHAVPATIICGCGYPHDPRPDTTSDVGCGAYWYDQDPGHG